MFAQDLVYGRTTLPCTCCGTPFVLSAYHAQYYSVTCRLREQKRRLRAQMKQAKALRAQGQSLRQIAEVRIWDAQSGRILVAFSYDVGIEEALFLTDGKAILTAGGFTTAWKQDANNGRVLATLKGSVYSSPNSSILVSTDGKRILTTVGLLSNDLQLWDSRDGRLVATIGGHTQYITVARFFLDGKRLLTASRDRTARVWDARNGQLNAILAGHTNSIVDATFSPDGSRVVTAGDGTVRLWNAESGNLLATFYTVTGPPNRAVFSTDGKHILVAGFMPVAPIYTADLGELLVWGESLRPRDSGL